jgi:maltose O-acetyltransferase
MIRHLINLFLYHLPPSRLFIFRSFLLRLGSVNLGANVAYCGRGWIYGRGEIVIGQDTWISPGVNFYTHTDATIKIGEKCDIGPGVEFIVGSHVIGNSSRRGGDGVARSITIGDGTWIGAGVRILDGVNIGSGCVVAAGSVVLRSVEDNCLIAGVPAIVKRKLIDQ